MSRQLNEEGRTKDPSAEGFSYMSVDTESRNIPWTKGRKAFPIKNRIQRIRIDLFLFMISSSKTDIIYIV